MGDWNTFQAEFKSELRRSEGVINHMYLDSLGHVTVGIGNLLRTVTDAQRLPFVHRTTKQRASAEEIRKDFESVRSASRNRRAGYYEDKTSLILLDDEIERLFDSRIREFRAQLHHHFSGFDDYPVAAQAALLDMVFNVGMRGLVTSFPRLVAAVQEQDWNTAASESSRRDVSQQRNETVKQWFLQAARETVPTGAN